MSICDGCGREDYRFRYVYNKDGRKTQVNCSLCGKIGKTTVPDVFLGKGQETSNMNLWDKKNNRRFDYSTKGGKAAIMKKLNLTEAGDRTHGGR